MKYDKNFALTTDNFYVYPTQNRLEEEGIWEPWLRQIILDNVKPGNVCYDIGASSFYFSELMARASGPNGSVYSFEPLPALVDLYKKAQLKNSYDQMSRIDIFNFGLSNENRDADIFIPIVGWQGATNDTGGSTIDPSKHEFQRSGYIYETEKIALKRLDILNIDNRVPDFLKMDIEGHEWEAWQGFPEHIKQAKIIAIELTMTSEDELLQEICTNRTAFNQNNGQLIGGYKELKRFLIQGKHKNILLK